MERCDFHIHTCWSDGRPTVEEIIKAATDMGLDRICITDHYDRYDEHLCNRWKTDDELLAHYDHIREIGDKSGILVYAGIEVATGMDGKLRISDKVQQESDIIICSPHYVYHDFETVEGEYFNDRYWERYKELLLAQALNTADVAGHPEGYLPCLNMLGDTTFERRQELRAEIAERYLDYEFYVEYASLLSKSGKAFEIHGASGTPREWVLELLDSYGVSFSIGSDAHDFPLLGRNERAWRLCEENHYMVKTPIGKRRFEICRK